MQNLEKLFREKLISPLLKTQEKDFHDCKLQGTLNDLMHRVYLE